MLFLKYGRWVCRVSLANANAILITKFFFFKIYTWSLALVVHEKHPEMEISQSLLQILYKVKQITYVHQLSTIYRNSILEKLQRYYLFLLLFEMMNNVIISPTTIGRRLSKINNSRLLTEKKNSIIFYFKAKIT